VRIVFGRFILRGCPGENESAEATHDRAPRGARPNLGLETDPVAGVALLRRDEGRNGLLGRTELHSQSDGRLAPNCADAHTGAAHEENINHLCASLPCSEVQRGLPTDRDCIYRRAKVQQALDKRCVAAPSRHVKRCLAIGVAYPQDDLQALLSYLRADLLGNRV